MLNKTTGTIGALVIGAVIVVMGGFGINDAGYRTVIQYPNGTMRVKFDAGWYMKWFGKTTTYNDVITYDYDGGAAEGTIADNGVQVRYQDGGTGTVFGKDRFRLPLDPKLQLALHREFRSNAGFANRLVRPLVKQSHNLTAGLMTSEAAYAEKRSTYIEWVQSQISDGRFMTVLEKVTDIDIATGKKVTKNVPKIKKVKGVAVHAKNPLDDYGVAISTAQITNWTFEKKTLKQISEKRKATMAIITAKANALRAKQDAITAEEQGKANVKEAQYKEEVLKIKQVVIAQRKAEVAVINAKQKVDVAEQVKFEAVQKKLAALQLKKRDIARGQGLAEKKRLIFQADGALKEKLGAWVAVNSKYADSIANYKGDWVSRVRMGGNGSASGQNGAQDMIDLLSIKTAKDLALDMKMGTSK